MARSKQNVRSAWGRNIMLEGANRRLLDEIEYYDEGLQRDIQESADRSAKLQYDIAQTRDDIRRLNEDPDGYFYEKEQRELESKPKTIKNYLKNWWASLGRQMNDFQIEDAQGYKDRADQWERLAEALKEQWDIEDRVNEINSEVDVYRALHTADPRKMQEYTNKINALLAEQNQLMLRHKQLEPAVKAFKSYIPGGVRARYYDLVAGNGENSILANNPIFGRTTQAHDELGDITRHTASMFAPNRTRDEQRAMLSRALEEKQNKEKEWQTVIDKNIADRESYNKVDRWFKNREDAAGTDIFDKSTWLYKMPGLIAGSASGGGKILPAMAIGIATAAAAGATGGLAGLGILALGGAGAYGLNYGAGVAENNAEVATAYNERIEDYLKNQKTKSGKSNLYEDIVNEGREKLNLPKDLDNKQVFELFRAGEYTTNNAAADKKMQELATGIESQFQDDMAAVTWTAGLETVLQVLPIKGLSASRLAKYQMLKTAARREALRNGKFANAAEQIQKGFDIGSVTGGLGALLYAPLHYATQPLRKRVGKAVSSMFDDIAVTSEIADKLPKDILAHKFMSEPTRRYLKTIGGRYVQSSIAEGIEEGKQHIASERYKRGEYTSAEIKSIGETILDDFFAGSKSAALMLGMPFEGLMSEEDRRTLQEIKGGAIMGGLQTGIVNVSQAIAPYIKERKASSVVLNSILLDKASKVDALQKGKMYAEASKSSSAYQNVADAFNRLRTLNNDQNEHFGEYGVDPEAIDAEQKRFDKIARMANDPYSIKQAESQGIKRGTEEYNEFVSAKALAIDELNDQKDVVEAAKKNFDDTNQRITEEVLTERLRLSGMGEEDEGELFTSPIAGYTSAEGYNLLQNVARYTALLRRKQQLELGIYNAERGGHDKIKQILNRQLTSIESQINNLKPLIEKYSHEDESFDINDVESVERSLVLNKPTHDDLASAYHDIIAADQDYELALEQYEGVVGKMKLNGEDVAPGKQVDYDKEFDNITFVDGHAKDVIKQIHDTFEDDNDLASVIAEDFDKRTDDEGNEVVTPEEAAAEESTVVPEIDPEEEFVRNVEGGRKSYVSPSTNISTANYQDVFQNPVSQNVVVKDGPKGWKSDDKKANKTRRVYLKGKEDKGYFEVVKDEEDNYYSVHFKPTDSKNSNAFTKEEKAELFLALADIIPVGGSVSTWGSVSKGGLAGILRFANLGFEKTGTRKLTRKDDGKPVEVAVYTKTNKAILSASEPTSTTQRTVGPQAPQTTLEEPETQPSGPVVPPTPPTPPITPTEFTEPSEEQNRVILALNKKAELSKQYVKEVTPEYYLIDVEGTEIKMPRVHSVMPKYWADDGMFMPALQVGNAIDNLARLFFGDKNNIVLYETDKQALVQRLANEYASHKDNPNDPSLNKLQKLYYRDLFNRPEEFEKTIDDLYQLFKQYQRLGWELNTEPVVWYAQFANGWVAGETDMLAVDRDGNIHIIDFKTASSKEGSGINPFGRYTNKYTYKIPAQLEERLLELNKSDFTVGPRGKGLSKAARKLAKDIRKYKGSRNIIIVWDDDQQRATMRYVASDYSNNASSVFRTTHVFNGEIKGSKENEYSDQLTAYREMIQKNLFNVVDMEVVGLRADYNYTVKDDSADLTSINSVRNEYGGHPFRVKVFDSDEMKNILNNEGSPVEVITNDPDPVTDAADKNEGSNQIGAQMAGKTNTFLPKDPEPEVVPPATNVEISTETPVIKGPSNLNVNVVNRHKELVQGAVYDKLFLDELIANGSVELYTKVITDRQGTVPSLYANITYKGKTYEGIFIYADPGLLLKVQQLEQKKTKDQKIVATKMSRTAGKMETGETTSVLSSGLVSQSPAQLEFTSTNKSFGYVKGKMVTAFIGDNIKMEDKIYEFPNNIPAEGTMVYLKTLPRSTSEGRDAVIPVPVSKRSLAGDADFIVDCLRNVNILNRPYTIVVGGRDVSIGATRKELLDLIIPYIDDTTQWRARYSIARDPRYPSMFYIIDGKNNVLSQVNMLDELSISAFKQSLKNFYIEETPEILISKMGSPNAVPAFKKIYQFFANDRTGTRSLSLSDTLKFDFEDFQQGLSGLGWYVKHGAFVSNFAELSSPKISINDVAIAQQQAPIEDNTPVDTAQPLEQTTGFSLEDFDFTNWGGLSKYKTAADENKPRLTEETIKKNLRPILGDIVDDPSVVNVIQTLASDPRVENAQVVGKASASAITLYNNAFEGVEYHEAFHRIFELFVPENVREAIYQKVADRLGIDLSLSNENNNYMQHRQVAEWLADEYMKSKTQKYTGIEWLDKIIRFIRDRVNALCRISNRDLYKVFLDINSGKYASSKKNPRKASKESIDRFNKLFGELNYEIHGETFNNVVNDQMYDELKNSVFYCVVTGQNIDVSGSTIQNALITREAFMRGADKLSAKGFDIFGKNVDPEKRSAAQLAMTEMYVRFDAIADDIAAMLAAISTDYRKIMQLEGREDIDGGESMSSYDENFFKWSYEFDKFDKTTSRVKFFFSTIPDLEFADDTHKTYKHATNSLGLPLFVPMNFVYNNVLSNLWDVDTIEEVVARLTNLAVLDPMYAIIANNIRKVIAGRVNKDGTLNADNEALLAQLMTTIRSNRHTFMLLRTVANPEGLYDIVVQRSDADYNAKMFAQQWSLVLSKGGTEILKVNELGQVVFNPRNKYAVNVFSKVATLFTQLQNIVNTVNNGKGEVIVPDYDTWQYEIDSSIGATSLDIRPEETLTDITDPLQCEKAKAAIIDALNHLGVNIHLEELNYMLTGKYGSSDWEAIKQMLSSTDVVDSIGSFMFFLNNIVKDGKLNLNSSGNFINQKGKEISFDNVFSDMAFIKELGNWKYEYRHSRDQLSILATGGNRFYEMSDNDFTTDMLRSLNKRGKWFYDLKEDPYNYYVGDLNNFGKHNVYGSISLKQLSENPNLKMAIDHFIGFKTDKKGDEGQDYFEISRREDYLSKVGILENDGMISLTLSDKKKYFYVTGIKLPGIDYTKIHKLDTLYVDQSLAELLIYYPDEISSAVYNILQRLDVIDLMISYAISEHESILRNAERLNDGHRKIANFDTNQQSVKFSSLLGVWETTYDKDGKPNGEQFISFNDSKKSWEENLSIAEAYFFDRTKEEQEALIGRILTKRAEKELDTLVGLGLIEKVGNNSNPFLNYKNVGLNSRVIKSIKASYLVSGRNLQDYEAESLAVVMYVNDISAKAIMSGQEMERLFSGNPAFYKWTYDKNGNLVDRTVDELKRLGGLGSTGVNNFVELTHIPQKYLENGQFTGKYRCAEVDNEMVSSPQFEQMQQSMYEGLLRSSLIDDMVILTLSDLQKDHDINIMSIRRIKDISEAEKQNLINAENVEYQGRIQEAREHVCSVIDNKTLEQLEKDYPEASASAKINAKRISDALAKGIDVADGGAYITDTMAEMLLRMEGAYSKEIQEAFAILREETPTDYLGKIEAYQKVLTSVIGNQKYTAFGRRMVNGNYTPYYHKMALFPIFKCIATGKLSNVYDKMQEQGIDMLLVNSAVKVGSEGSKPIEWNKYREDDDPTNQNNFSQQGIDGWQWKPTFQESFNFETYDCEFDFLRKQLNTDPKEEELLRMGTQMLKVIFSNLVLGRTYTEQSGETITGKKLLDRIMNSSNKLSDIGVDKMNKRFFVTNENGELIDAEGNVIAYRNSDKRLLDVEKFSKEVSKMMSDRGADKNIMKALELVTTTAGKQLQIPLGAISNSSWLESVLISELNKEIIDVNTPGAFFIQRSVWGMQGSRMYDNQKGSIKGRQLYNGKRLQMVNEEGSMDCVLSIDFFQHILPKVASDEYELDEDENYIYQKDSEGNYKTDKYGNYIPKRKMRDMTFDEARQWLLDQGIIGGKSNIIAYRIPTQAESSIHALRCVDVLPVVRDTVILPEEFTKITGSDFDLSLLKYKIPLIAGKP